MAEAPRIFVVLRQHMRKGRWHSIVQESHLLQIFEHGGVPVAVPRLKATIDLLDHYGPMHGLMIVEGPDIAIERYDGRIECSPERIEEPDLSRDTVEFALIDKVLNEGQPFLGICRGCHAMNIALGGSLYGDIMWELGSGLKHVDYDNYDGYRHPLAIHSDTPLYRWLKTTEFMANSYHHQGIRALGDGLVPMCHASDGLIEGFYDPSHPFRMGLQFHPERHAADDGTCMDIFEAFVGAARTFAVKDNAGQERSAKG